MIHFSRHRGTIVKSKQSKYWFKNTFGVRVRVRTRLNAIGGLGWSRHPRKKDFETKTRPRPRPVLSTTTLVFWDVNLQNYITKLIVKLDQLLHKVQIPFIAYHRRLM